MEGTEPGSTSASHTDGTAPTPPPPARGPIAALLAAIPPEPLGFPRVAWVGGALFAVILLVVFSSYLF